MKYWERFIVYPLLGFMLIFILAILCKWYPRSITPQNLGFDYIGLIVGILSFLVTALLGWQIFNAIAFDKRINSEFNKYAITHNILLKQEVAMAKIDLMTYIRFSDFSGYIHNIASIYNISQNIPFLISQLPIESQGEKFDKEIAMVTKFIEQCKEESSIELIGKLCDSYVPYYPQYSSVSKFVDYLRELKREKEYAQWLKEMQARG